MCTITRAIKNFTKKKHFSKKLYSTLWFYGNDIFFPCILPIKNDHKLTLRYFWPFQTSTNLNKRLNLSEPNNIFLTDILWFHFVEDKSLRMQKLKSKPSIKLSIKIGQGFHIRIKI